MSHGGLTAEARGKWLSRRQEVGRRVRGLKVTVRWERAWVGSGRMNAAATVSWIKRTPDGKAGLVEDAGVDPGGGDVGVT